MVDPHDDPIELEPSRYDRWRDQFEAERSRIQNALEARGMAVAVDRIEHVGSTAVPGLAAKDIVDLDVVVADGRVAAVAAAIEAELGGTVAENSDEWHPVFREVDGQRFNVHVFAASSDRWKISVATREVLREGPDLCREYERHKRSLAADTDDLADYSTGKTEIVKRLLKAARGDDDVVLSFEVPAVEG